MFLKRLEMTGFKTFAERTEVEFVPGFMAVVGPNGSGKSNLTDALRYCLGEQSVKVLRGTRLEEMVFAGTPARRPAPMAEVTAVFDNSDGHLPVDFSEVAITRRTSRDGESTYLINKAPCRLRDVHELLMGSGIGPGSFSVLGGKEVDMVLSSDPKDRRFMLEETAGTNRYRFRKREAARKLDQTGANLTRLRDILQEVERGLDESRRSVERYERYKVAQDQLRGLERRIALHDLRRFQAQVEQVGVRTRALRASCAEADSQEQALASRLEELELRRAEAERLRDASQAALASTREQAGRARATFEALFQRAAELEHTARAARGRVESSQERLQSRTGEHEALAAALPALEAGLAEAAAALDGLRRQLQALPEGSRGPGAEIRARLAVLDRERNQLEGRLESHRQQEEQEARRREEALSQAAALRAESERGGPAAQGLDPLREAAAQAATSEREAEAGRQGAAGALRDARQERAELEKQRRPLAARKAQLEALLEDRSGLPPATRAAMAWKEPGTIGIVGELIRVPEGLETAMEAALGGRLHDVITRDRQTASRLVERLKRERVGRATFWPLDLDRREPDRPTLPGREGVVGWALDLLGHDPSLRPVLGQMIGNTVVMEDMASALALYDRCRGRRPHAVTLQGEVLSPSGALTGGSLRQDRAGTLARRRQLEETGRDLAGLEARIATLHAAEETQASRLAEAEAALGQAREAARQRRQELADLEAEQRRQQADADRARAAAERLEREAQGLEAKALQRAETRRGAQARLEALGEEWDGLRERLTRSQEEEARHQVEREALRRQAMAAELELERRRARLQEQRREVERLRTRHQELETDRLQAAQELERAVASRAGLDREGAELQRQIEALSARLGGEEQALEGIRAETARQGDQLKEIRQAHAEAARRARTLSEELYRQEVEGAGLEAHLEEARHRLEELDPDLDQPEPETGFAIEPARQQARRLRTFLEGFGSVNLGAREDFERLSGRHLELQTQITDLEEASESLRRIMAEMDRASVAQFEATFHRVNETFGRLFSEIFGGGSARLMLTDPGNLLDSGVDIVACPPGKKLQNLTLFSSGERALSAIAFLLSLLTHKPSPIVVLDELDAPLDDANVEKVASRLLEFSNSSQFLVITHNRKTMEFADRLYGVTMEEPGLSRLLSVELKSATADREPSSSDRREAIGVG